MNPGPALRAFFDPWLPRACALCDGRLGMREDGLCTECRRQTPGADALRCTCCGLRIASPSGACADCTGRADAPERTIVVADYAPPVDRLVLALKFGGEIAAARPIGVLLGHALSASDAPVPDALVPVPLGRERLVGRGYNQSLEIARAAARVAGVPVARGWLQRTRETPAQSTLALAARQSNLADAFRADGAVEGRCVALVDDVMTSGATLRAAAGALREAGARFVVNLVFARTP